MKLFKFVNPSSAYLILVVVLLIDLIAFLTGFLIITVLPLLVFSTFVAALGGYANLFKSEDRLKGLIRSSLVGSSCFLVLFYLYQNHSHRDLGLLLYTLIKIWAVRLAGGSLVGCVICWVGLLTRKQGRTITLLAAAISTGAAFIVVKGLGPILQRPDGWHLVNILVVLGLGVHLLFGGVTRPAFRLFERMLPEPAGRPPEDQPQ